MTKPLIIGGSAGSFAIIFKILPLLSSGFNYPLIICVHRAKTSPKGYLPLLMKYPNTPVWEPEHEEPIVSGYVYVAPADRHLLIGENNCFLLSDDPKVNFSRPSIDLTMKSAARYFGSNLIAILLSGANCDGAIGMKVIHDTGGITIVQDPADAEVSEMPDSAIELFNPSHIMSEIDIIHFIEKLNSDDI